MSFEQHWSRTSTKIEENSFLVRPDIDFFIASPNSYNIINLAFSYVFVIFVNRSRY